ncbi:MAG: hypothetical protein CL681_24825 [Blastopirellula sp.]|nr:hypothetical protein [Blastopirellula sp.]
MSLSYQCPYCGTKTLVEDQFAGQSGPCATCGKLITVPLHLPREADSAEAMVTSERQSPVPARGKAGGKNGMLLLVGLVLFGGVLVMGALSMLLFVFVAPAVNQSRISTMHFETTGNLQRIAAAMQAYAADHGTYPPAYLPDSAGQPMHSWRVLLLPYLGRQNLYDRYDFSEPWDSPNNIALQFQMPAVYACEADLDASLSYSTSYLVVVGEETMFPGVTALAPADVLDGVADTVMVVESHGSGISWLEPRDLRLNGMTVGVNGAQGADVFTSNPSGVAYVVTGDGQTHGLDETLTQNLLRAMMTAEGGEVVPWGDFEVQAK